MKKMVKMKAYKVSRKCGLQHGFLVKPNKFRKTAIDISIIGYPTFGDLLYLGQSRMLSKNRAKK